jgi:hypothetical protein
MIYLESWEIFLDGILRLGRGLSGGMCLTNLIEEGGLAEGRTSLMDAEIIQGNWN